MKVRLIVKAVAGLPAMAWRKRQLNRDVQAMVLGPGHKEYKLDWARIKARHLRSRESLSRFLREYAKEIVRIEREQKWLHGHIRPVPLARVRWIEQEIGLPITTVELSIKAERKRREIREFEKKEARKAKSPPEGQAGSYWGAGQGRTPANGRRVKQANWSNNSAVT